MGAYDKPKNGSVLKYDSIEKIDTAEAGIYETIKFI